jgi:hypothetical protein
MNPWTLLAELHIEVQREDLRPFAKTHLGAGLRRAGVTTEFTLAGAVACWRQRQPEPASACLALIWTNPTFSGTENLECLAELSGAKSLPMPFQFIASQPHMAAVYAHQFLPGLAHATLLVHADSDVETTLLPGLSHRHPWTHVLLGEVWTPHPLQPDPDRFTAKWRLLGRDSVAPGWPPTS